MLLLLLLLLLSLLLLSPWSSLYVENMLQYKLFRSFHSRGSPEMPQLLSFGLNIVTAAVNVLGRSWSEKRDSFMFGRNNGHRNSR